MPAAWNSLPLLIAIFYSCLEKLNYSPSKPHLSLWQMWFKWENYHLLGPGKDSKLSREEMPSLAGVPSRLVKSRASPWGWHIEKYKGNWYWVISQFVYSLLGVTNTKGPFCYHGTHPWQPLDWATSLSTRHMRTLPVVKVFGYLILIFMAKLMSL